MLTAPDITTLTDEIEDRSWWAEASCATGGAGLAALFFSEELQDIAAAKRICAECPMLATCLEGAMARREPWGVWGNLTFRFFPLLFCVIHRL